MREEEGFVKADDDADGTKKASAVCCVQNPTAAYQGSQANDCFILVVVVCKEENKGVTSNGCKETDDGLVLVVGGL